MVDNDTMILVRNFTGEKVVYKVPEDNVRRQFAPFEEKWIAAGELRKLSFLAGGLSLILNYLSVQNQELAEEFGVSEDLYTHEYSWTKEDIDRVLTVGSLDELKDAFDFAPTGIVNTIINRAVELRIPDMNKREWISSVTGKDINRKIEFQDSLLALNNSTNVEEPTKRRRVSANTNNETKTDRRVK